MDDEQKYFYVKFHIDPKLRSMDSFILTEDRDRASSWTDEDPSAEQEVPSQKNNSRREFQGNFERIRKYD